MRHLFKIILPILAFWGVSTQAQQLQNFSNPVVDLNLNWFYGSWEATGDTGGSVNPNSQFTQGTGVYNITGTSAIVPTNSADSKLEFFNASPISIGSNTYLSVTAQTLSTNSAGATSFAVFLVDSNDHTAFASFGTAAFPTGSYTTISGALTFGNGFNSTSITSIIITGGIPGGTDRFNVSFDNVSAVPEPSTYAALMGAAAMGLAVVWRKKRAA
jgi:hypothetical protein